MTQATRPGEWQGKTISNDPSPPPAITVLSGHFMVSELDDPEEDADQVLNCGPSGVVPDKGLSTAQFDLRTLGEGSQRSSRSLSCTSNSGTTSPAHKAPLVSPEDRWKFQAVGIDESLTSLLNCMTLAYTGKITSPKWNHFRGLQLTRKDKIRLNNIIWREYHMQYVKKLTSKVVQFAAPLSESHAKPEAVVMEGKYWKRRNMAVAVEYHRWRRFTAHKLRFPHQDISTESDTSREEPMDISLSFFTDSSIPGGMDFVDNFDKFLDEQPLTFPDPRDIGHVVNADFVQPGLIQLQPALEELSVDVIQAILQTPSMKPSIPKHNEGHLRGSSDLQLSTPPAVTTQDSPSAKFLPALLQMSSPSVVALASSISGNKSQSNLFSTPTTSASIERIPMEIAKPCPLSSSDSAESSGSYVLPECGQSLAMSLISSSSVPPPRHYAQQDPATSPHRFASQVFRQLLPLQEEQERHQLMKQGEQQMQASHTYGVHQQQMQRLHQPEQHQSMIHNQLQADQSILNQTQTGSLQQQVLFPKSKHDQGHRTQTNPSQSLILPLPQPAQPQQQQQSTLVVSNRGDLAPVNLPNQPHATNLPIPNQLDLQPVQYQSQQQQATLSLQTQSQPDFLQNQLLQRSRRQQAPQTVQNQIPESLPPRQSQLQQAAQLLQNQLFQTSHPLQSMVQQGPQPLTQTPSPQKHIHVPFRVETQVNQSSQSSTPETPRKIKKQSKQSSHVSPGQSSRKNKQTPYQSKVLQKQEVQPLQLQQESQRPIFQVQIQEFPLQQQPQIQQKFLRHPTAQQDHRLLHEQVHDISPPTTKFHDLLQSGSLEERTSGSPLVSPERLHRLRKSGSPEDFPFHLRSYKGRAVSQSSLVTPPRSSPVAQTSMDTSPATLSPAGDPDGISPDRRQGSTELKRRSGINAAFDLLQSLIPSLAGNPHSRVSKATLLHKSAALIRDLKREKIHADAEMAVLRAEIDNLNNQISTFCSQLPDTGIAVSTQKENKGNEWFEAYVRASTLLNWKFYIFSLFIGDLFNSFNNTVSLLNLDDFERTVGAWLEQHCSLIKLRPAVTTSLRRLSTTTAILNEPGAVPQQALQIVQKQLSPQSEKCQPRWRSGSGLKSDRLEIIASGDEDSDDAMLPPPPPHPSYTPSSFLPRQ